MIEFPKTYDANLKYRAELLMECEKDRTIRDAVRRMFFEDILFAFNLFFYTLDPRKRKNPSHNLPFCTWEFQDPAIRDIVKSIEDGKDLLIEKSRDMGCTWQVLLVFLWYWLDPKGGTDFLIGSRIETYVDKKGDRRALFSKLRYAMYRLPPWILPRGFNEVKHDSFMKLENPETGSTITGESNNPNFSTAGRYTAIFFDEFAKWENTDESAWTAAGDATPCRVAGSTPFGAAGQYYGLATDGKTKKLRLHWTLHPEKANGAYCNWPRSKDNEDLEGAELEQLTRSPWYDMECARRTPMEIAQELDINYIGAGALVFDANAGRRVLRLLRAQRTPVKFIDFDLGRMVLRETNEPREIEGFLCVWAPPDPATPYVFGIDVVEGRETGDFAVIKVMNRFTKSIDASYFSRIDEVSLARVITLLSEYWETFTLPWIGIETCKYGLATFDLLVEMYGITNLFMTPRYDQATQQISHKKGWVTSTVSRDRLISGIKDWLIQGEGWCDQRLCREFTTFVRNKNGKAEAKPGANDDEVMAFGIAVQVDTMVPAEYKSADDKRRADGLPEGVFDQLRTPIEEPTIEERCLASLVEKKHVQESLRDDFFEIYV